MDQLVTERFLTRAHPSAEFTQECSLKSCQNDLFKAIYIQYIEARTFHHLRH